MEPLEPNAEDCCNSGCNPCIFDIYEQQLKAFRKKKLNGDNLNVIQNGISQWKYTKFVVVKNFPICDFHNCVTFKRIAQNDTTVWWKPGDHFLLKYSSNQNSCTRAYTPIKVKNELSEDYDFSIFAKKYDCGLVSTYLCNLKEGDTTLWRGPYGHYKMEPNKYDRIIMIAQGTGIAPFITIIDEILNDEDNMTKIRLLYCCKCENSILFRDILYAFKSYWNFTYDIFLSTSCTSNFKCKYQEPIKQHRLNKEYLFKLKPFLQNDQVLICGAPTFIEAYKTHLEGEILNKENIIMF
ncbi:NADH-cytochrome b5 reductase-like [Helicoverpa zea]|uniref:NADH-cytochrome b5 reductase-like n=1 Tax=Helicoverpa zea TaxID=7113 RepID=UPI001F5A3EB4|nr:NADH-cytochrome b5 reductase-like [Helicoverpa zea]XP_047019884.1 NADH-cytochrome b5 reductase-like [Helicoverpa zea]